MSHDGHVFYSQIEKFSFGSSVCKSNTEGRKKIICTVKIFWLLKIQYPYGVNRLDAYDI